ncbi:MAG TPA: flippase [Thiolinea sp.]|nr:flippase [Thiolinea sp.]
MNITPAFIRKRIAHRPNLLKIIDNIGWLFFDKVLRMGVGLIVGVWVARYLGPEQFGLLSFATAFVGLFGAIAGLGLQGIVVRDIVRDPSCKEVTLGTTAMLQFFGGLITYGLILGTIFWLRPDDALAKMLVAILGSSMLLKASEVSVYWFESQVLSKYTVWVQNASFLVFAVIKVLLILHNAPLIAFAWATLAEALVVALLMGVMLSLRGPRLRQLRITLEHAKTLLKDSWPLLLSGIAIMIYIKIDQIMLGQMLGDEAVGIYSAAVRISEVWYFIPMMIVASVFPAILEAKKRNEAQYYQRLQHLYDLMVWLSIAVAMPMTFLSTPIVTLLFGEAFAASGPVLAIHIWAAAFVFLGVASSKWYLTEGLQVISFQKALLGALANILLNYSLIPIFGAVGAAWSTVISYALADFFFDSIQKKTRRAFKMKLASLNLFKTSRQFL